MRKRLCLALVALLAPALLAAGCGGGGAKTGPTTGLSIKQAKQINKENTNKSVSECLQAANNPGLPADEKPLVETQCQDIRTGNNVALHTVDVQLCKVQANHQPEPVRSQRLAKCKTL